MQNMPFKALKPTCFSRPNLILQARKTCVSKLPAANLNHITVVKVSKIQSSFFHKTLVSIVQAWLRSLVIWW